MLKFLRSPTFEGRPKQKTPAKMQKRYLWRKRRKKGEYKRKRSGGGETSVNVSV